MTIPTVLAWAVTAAFVAMLSAGWVVFEFDFALLGYALMCVLAVFFTVQRTALWIMRPPTWMFFRRFAGDLKALHPQLLRRIGEYFALNRFVFKRGLKRWGAHWPVMVGCIMASAIVFPLVFGWVWFETVDGHFDQYVVHAFGIPLRTISIHGFEAFMMFHGLVWASVPVVIGCVVALIRRSRDRGDAATQHFAADILPLLALLAVALTGLALAASYTWLAGGGYIFLAWAHALTVMFTLIALPYSKLLHIVQRSLKLAQFLYAEQAGREGPATCSRCSAPFASQRQISDLQAVEAELGFTYHLADGGHYQSVCPRCRRAMLVLAQGRRWRGVAADAMPAAEPEATPAHEEVA